MGRVCGCGCGCVRVGVGAFVCVCVGVPMCAGVGVSRCGYGRVRVWLQVSTWWARWHVCVCGVWVRFFFLKKVFSFFFQKFKEFSEVSFPKLLGGVFSFKF